MDSPTSISGQVTRKKRRPAPRVKTGCLTCKYRRVKCGEERPICHRCIKFDVQCEGYPTEISSRSCKSRQLLPTLRQEPSSSLFENEIERQYFDLFCTRTGFEILSELKSGSIRQMLLQSCHSNASIRCAIIAIGALDKKAEMMRDFGRLSLDTSGSEHHTAALQQYSKAVRHMNRATIDSQMDLRTTLLTCLLIICFEAWNGNLQLAVQQVHIGINILQEWEARYHSQNGERRNTLSPAPEAIDHDLMQTFCCLAIQLSFADASSISTREILASESRTRASCIPDTFLELKEAAMYQQALQRRGGYFIATYGTAWGSGNPSPTPSVIAEKIEIETDARKWLSAFEPLVKTATAIEEKRRAYTILLQVMSGLVSISTSLTTSEMVYDIYTDIFTQIVSLAEEVMASYPENGQVCNTHFCFDARIILPLWKTGLKCRDGETRKRCVGLLLGRSVKEGIWDSVLAGKMVGWVMECEEEFSDNDGVPEWARIRGVKCSSDLESRTALLMCRQREFEFGDEIVRRKIVGW